MTNRTGVLAFVVVALLLLIPAAHDFFLTVVPFILLFFFLLVTFPLAGFLFPGKALARIFVFPIGYILHAVLLSLFGRLFGVSGFIFFLYFAGWILIALLFHLKRSRVVVEENSETLNIIWTEPDTFALMLWLLMTILIVALPFWNVGAPTPYGFAYRAYFNADFFRNMSVSGSLSHSGIPPDNPYVAGFQLRYYWFFHIIPAFWERVFPNIRLDVLMVQFSLAVVCMFVASLYACIRSFVSTRMTLLLTFPLFAFGGSYEGIYILQRIRDHHLPWQSFTELNIDGILRWWWNAPQVDTLYRGLLYAPQHLLALCIFLILLLVWRSKRGRSLLFILLMSSLGFSAFIGAILILSSGLLLLYEFLRQPRKEFRDLLIFGLFGLVFLVLYFHLFRMFELHSNRLTIGIDANLIQRLPLFFILNWGALLIIGIAGIIYNNQRRLVFVLSSFFIMNALIIVFVKLNLPGFSDISLKLGHFTSVVLLLLAACFIDRLIDSGRTKAAMAALLVVVLPACLTWVMDAYNSRDITNPKFTTYIHPDDARVYAWMRQNLPHRTVVEDYARFESNFIRGFVSEVPTFAERSLFLGDRNFSRIFEVPSKQLEIRRRILTKLLREKTSERLCADTSAAGIDYLFFSSKDSDSNSAAIKLVIEPYFTVLKQEGNSLVAQVNATRCKPKL
jgi:hypothetical protein